MPPISHQPGFHCPVCGSEGYVHVTVRRPDDTLKATSLFQCCGCSAAFVDPEKFTARKRMVLQRTGMTDFWSLVPAPDQPDRKTAPERKPRG